ncbi:metallophosphoesterase [Virgibacillus litoralis]|uniref:MPP superfamily phosphohydrolase n=1 Tax=Virgibacillus litoralis TaxID=578221 RepID=A0ABS4HF31_9BACI|nr:metallophosphoesterase [Virgibacillus litoralis]MBP1949540.1 putative MPP superfamily phosphohydrolase [Virgibacillus litoralis]
MIYIISACVLILSVFILYMIYNAHHDTIDFRTIKVTDLSSEFNLFFISDIHRRKVRTDTLRSIDEYIKLVVIGGDLTEKGVPISRTRENIHKLKEFGAPIYFVWGNNDYEALTSKVYELLISEGVIILTNNNDDILIGSQTISLMGLDCCQYSEARMDLAMINSTGFYNILLTHDPSAFYETEEEFQNKVDIVLAGHTHGGQIRIFGFGYFEKGGLTKLHNTKILVSEGYGYTRLPFRLGTKSECHVLTFKQ